MFQSLAADGGVSDSNFRIRHQLFTSPTESLSSLAQQQTGQQAQLEQISTNLHDITARLAQLSVPPAAEAEPVTPAPAMTGSLPVSKPDKFDGAPNHCRGFCLLQCSIFSSAPSPSWDGLSQATNGLPDGGA